MEQYGLNHKDLLCLLLQVRIQELASLQEMLASGEDVQRKRMGELSRRVTLLQVNEKTLSRRYTMLLESEAALRKVG